MIFITFIWYFLLVNLLPCLPILTHAKVLLLCGTYYIQDSSENNFREYEAVKTQNLLSKVPMTLSKYWCFQKNSRYRTEESGWFSNLPQIFNLFDQQNFLISHISLPLSFNIFLYLSWFSWQYPVSKRSV